MSAGTIVVGYPVHRLVTYRQWRNPQGVSFTDWTGACGATGTVTGEFDRFSKAGQARRAELCRGCFPTGARGGVFPPPERIGNLA